MAGDQDWLREVLDEGWTEADLRRAQRLAEQLDTSPAALQALRDYDELRDTLSDTLSDESASTPTATPTTTPTAMPEPRGGLSGFEQRMLHAVQPQPLRGPWWRSRWSGLAAILALVAGLGIITWQATSSLETDEHGAFPSHAHEHPAERRADVWDAALPSDSEAAAHIYAFSHISQTFDGRVRWASLGEGEPTMGLASEPLNAHQRLLLVRLTLERDGEVAARHDVVVVPGQDAELTATLHGRELRYLIATRDTQPATLSIWAELSDPDRPRELLAALATQLHVEPGQVRPAGELVSTAGRYSVRVGMYESTMREARP